jgi:CSLREA domain-containing protein
MPRPALWIVLCLATGLAWAHSATALGAAIPVNTGADVVANDGKCSLREAVTAANANASSGASAGECPAGGSAGADTITLGAGSFGLSRDGARENVNATGDLDVVSGSVLTISGAGASSTIIDATGIPGLHDRVLDVKAGATATIQGVTLTGGHAPDGDKGADRTGTGDHGGDGSAGGGIANAGTLTVASSTILGNVSGKGGDGGEGDGADGGSGLKGGGGNGGDGGGAGNGGGIYNNAGTVTVTSSTLSSNHTGVGGAGGIARGGDGGTAAGGVGPSGDGGNAVGGYAGPSGYGGGIYSYGALTVTNSTIADNFVGNAGGGGFGDGGGGGGGNQPGDGGNGSGGRGGFSGSGGGIFSDFHGTLTLTASTLARNKAGKGGDGGSGFGGPTTYGGSGSGLGGPADNGGDGGGMEVGKGTATNATIVANQAGSGGKGGDAIGQSKQAGDGGTGGSGGGVLTSALTVNLLHDTIASNASGAGGAGGETGIKSGKPGSGGTGGALRDPSGSSTVANTIVSGDCDGMASDFGGNLATQPFLCPGTPGDPKLGALQDNGGPTQTEALGPGSEAIDKIPATGAGCPQTDQRGGRRPAGPLCDIGAFEAGATFPSEVTAAGTGKTTDRTAPTGQVTVDPTTFAVAGAATPITAALSRRRVAKGTTIGYRLSEAANVTLSIEQKTLGLKLRRGKAKRRCVGATRRNRRALVKQVKRTLGPNARGPAGHRRVARQLRRSNCVLFVGRGTLRRHGSSGSNRMPFSGRIATKALRVGRYRVVLVATDSAGNRSTRVYASFRVVSAGAKNKRSRSKS